MTTRHTCGGPVFGKKTAGCPRCDELLAGAEPVRWNMTSRDDDRRRSAEFRAHANAYHHHTATRGFWCDKNGAVCTFGEH